MFKFRGRRSKDQKIPEDVGFTGKKGVNPFDSDSDTDLKEQKKIPVKPSPNENVWNEDDGASSYTNPRHTKRDDYENDFRDTGGFDNQSVQELEDYAAYKAEETTGTVKNCLKIAEEINEEATNTLITLHHQGQQITRTHEETVYVDQDLSRGEKLLGSLGGMFSRTWKPKNTRVIKGPAYIENDTVQTKGSHLVQRERLGLNNRETSKPQRKYANPDSTSSSLQKVEIEKTKQDDGLDDLSNMLDRMKNMATDMGTEIDRHNQALDPMERDVEALSIGVQEATKRGRRLLGK
ncbi:putative Synaptosomal associated protein [Zostera marina]|uniref:Putative Synaptosomal associated protein n=1 Tax=Zostera marina TaxID=29655 RepID=A0A0K9PPJ3_ZOSMR|nr:putative Synaptosomal associated protein [Zostera marina]